MENKEYCGDVLSIEQMKELESLGLDLSDASCMWNSIQDKDYKPIRWLPCFRGEDRQTIELLEMSFPMTYQKGNIFYCYTLNDVLEKLHKELDKFQYSNEHGNFKLTNVYGHRWKVMYSRPYVDGTTQLKIEYYNKLIDAAFTMLKWCISTEHNLHPNTHMAYVDGCEGKDYTSIVTIDTETGKVVKEEIQ